MKFDEEESLVSAFREQIRHEKELEDAKIRLAAQPDFNLMDAYQMIDKHNKGWVTAADLTDALADYGLYPHKDDVYLFVRRYDRDSDGRVLYSDFCDAFCPKDSLSSSILNRR